MKYKILVCLFFFVVCASLLVSIETPQVQAYPQSGSRVFYTGSDDGWLEESHITYSTARNDPTGDVHNTENFIDIGQELDVTYYFYRGCLYFDTSILPWDTNVTSAVLSLYIWIDYSVTDFNVTVQSGMPTYPHRPMVSGDYNRSHYSGNGGSRNTAGCGTGWWNITLNSNGRSWVNPTGYTKFMLRSQEDIDASAPTGDEFLRLRSAEYSATYSARLYIYYDYGTAYLFNLYGAYNEQGSRDGNISVSFFRPTQERLNFTLDGFYNVTSEEDTRMVFHFDLGNNESRVFYVGDTNFMDIFVFKPTQPYYTYYFSVIDYVGITNAYLETLLNINGTDRIVERWRLDVLNDIPFTLSWGVAYKVRISCDQGTYDYGMYVAGATFEFTIPVTSNMFPPSATHIGNITINANRTQANTIQLNYTDAANQTDWVQVQIFAYTSTSASYTTNNTGNTHQINWNNADNFTDYRVAVLAGHQVRGEIWWSVVLPALEDARENPFDFSFLGTFPFDSSQLIGVVITGFTFATFSAKSKEIGVFSGTMVAIILTAIGFMNISWAWLTVCFAITILVIFSMRKDKGVVVS